MGSKRRRLAVPAVPWIRFCTPLLAVALAFAATACSSDVVCEDAANGLCSVKAKSDCQGAAHEMTEADKELTGTKNRGSETCYRLGYTAPYLGGYTRPARN